MNSARQRIDGSDTELISSFLKGNVDAFNTLVIRWEKTVYNFILRYVGDEDEAKDICQESFIKVYKNIRKFEGRANFSTWLYRIAINQCNDQLKKRKQLNYIVDIDLSELDDGMLANYNSRDKEGNDQPDKQYQRSELRRILKNALTLLPDEQRLVVVLKEYQGLKFKEIAKLLKCSENTAKSRMYYGLTTLKRVLKRMKVGMEMISYDM